MAKDLPPAGSVDLAAAARAVELGAQALSLIDARDFTEARSIAEQALRLDPRAARARAALAACLFSQAAVEEPPIMSLVNEAEGEYLRAQSIAPEDPVIGLHHAHFLAGVGHLNAAVDRLETLTALHPKDGKLLSALGRIHYDLGHERDALGYLDRFLAIKPADALSHYLLAHCILRLAPEVEKPSRADEYHKAAAEFARYRELAPEDVDGILGEAHARFQALALDEAEGSGSAEEILALYSLALERDPKLVEAWFSQGVVLDHLQRGTQARAAYAQALGMNPNHLPSLLNLAASLSDEGKAGEAQEFLRRALAAGGLSRSERQRIEKLLTTRRP